MLNCPVAVASSVDCARAVVDAHTPHRSKPLIASWVGGDHQRDARRLFNEHGVPSFETPEDAVRAFMYLVNYQRSQAALLETPPSLPLAIAPDREPCAAIVADALATRRRLARRRKLRAN